MRPALREPRAVQGLGAPLWLLSNTSSSLGILLERATCLNNLEQAKTVPCQLMANAPHDLPKPRGIDLATGCAEHHPASPIKEIGANAKRARKWTSGDCSAFNESSFISVSQFFEPLLGVIGNPIPCVGLLREIIHVHFRPVGKCDNDHPVMPRLHGPGLKPDLGARFGHGSQYAPKALKSRTPSLEAASARRLRSSRRWGARGTAGALFVAARTSAAPHQCTS